MSKELLRDIAKVKKQLSKLFKAKFEFSDKFNLEMAEKITFYGIDEVIISLNIAFEKVSIQGANRVIDYSYGILRNRYYRTLDHGIIEK